MGRFTGTLINPSALGGKGFFSLANAAPATPTAQMVIQAGNNAGVLGWEGINTVGGGDVTGVLLSGSAPPFPGTSALIIGDGVFFVGTQFGVQWNGIAAQNLFTALRIVELGLTYATAAANNFSNNGGCGPTTWAWNTQAPFLIGTHYSIVWS